MMPGLKGYAGDIDIALTIAFLFITVNESVMQFYFKTIRNLLYVHHTTPPDSPQYHLHLMLDLVR